MASTSATPISRVELKALIQAEIASALGNDGSRLQAARVKAEDYYLGRPFGNEVDGRSAIVSRDVQETVEWIMPMLMRIFTGGDRVVEFEPAQESDIPLAKQATEYINFIFSKDNNGFLIFYSLFKDALVQKRGIGKIWWDDADIEKRERYYGLDDEAFASLVNADDVTVSEHTENQEEIELPPVPDPQTGELTPQKPQQITTHDVVVTRKKPGGRVCIHPVPPEEFLISKDARSIEDARLVGHRVRTTLSELREDGVSEELISQLGTVNDTFNNNIEEIARNTVEDQTASDTAMNKAMSEIWKTECFIKADVDGDGIAEMRKVTVAGPGSVILSDEAWDGARPFFSVTPIIMPHRFWGLSLADMVMDIQLIRSTILRQYLDNLYVTNHPMIEAVADDVIDPTEILERRPGAVVRVKRQGTLTQMAVPAIGRESIQGLEYIDRIREQRTGVSERTQGLGANDLQDETLGGARMMMSAAMGKIELIARVFAETGVKDAFKLALQLVCRYQQKARIIRLTDNWVPMDPRSWDEDMDVTVSVGMGTGDNEQKLQHAMLLGQAQQAAVPMGLATPENLYNTAELMVNAMGLKGVDKYFTKPQPGQPAPQPAPNPKDVAAAQRIQQQTQHDAESHQLNIATQQAKTAGDAQKTQVNAQIQVAQMQSQTQLEQQKAAHESVLAMQELYLKKYQIDNEIALKAEEMRANVAIKQQSAENVRLGGEPG